MAFQTNGKRYLHLLKKIYKNGYKYKKAGVMLLDLVPVQNIQFYLFTKIDHSRNEKLMEAFDKINSSWGSQTIRSAASGFARPWAMKRSKISPRFTTSWDDIIRV